MLIKSAENPSHFYHLAVLVIKRVQRVLPKFHANRAIIRTLTVTYGTLQKNKRSSVLNLPKQRQLCPSLFFQFNMRISVIYGTPSVSCKRVVRVLSPLASNSCGGSQLLASQRSPFLNKAATFPNFQREGKVRVSREGLNNLVRLALITEAEKGQKTPNQPKSESQVAKAMAMETAQEPDLAFEKLRLLGD